MAWYDEQLSPAPTRKFVRIDLTTTGDHTLVPAVSGKRIVVTSYEIDNNAGVADTIIWKSGSTEIWRESIQDKERDGDDFVDGLFWTELGESLVANVSAANPNVQGRATYVELPL